MAGQPLTTDPSPSAPLERFFDRSPGLFAISSLEDGRWLRVNAALGGLLGTATGAAAVTHPLELAVEADRPLLAEQLGALLHGDDRELDVTFAFRRPDRDRLRILRWKVVADTDARVAYWYGVDATGLLTSEQVALENAERVHRISLELQQSLLPRALPGMATVTLAARYRPATAGMAVGGDWYDAIELEGGRLLLMVGDVVGHGVRSAAAMGRISAAAHALAPSHQDPGELLGQLDRLARDDRAAHLTTVVAAVIDPADDLIRYSLAGHPPPLIRYQVDGTVTVLDAAVGPPLGVATGDRPVAQLRTRGPHRLVLYTDGLVERRGESIDQGIAKVAWALERSGSDPESCCDAVLAAATDETLGDDLALLCAFVDATGA
jgi:hypothetical protein